MIYNLLLILGTLLFLPRMLYLYFSCGKYSENFLYRLGLKIPAIPKNPAEKRFWFHAASVGEVKALRPLVSLIAQKHPEAFILISTVTETGQHEAKRIYPNHHTTYLPLDLSFIMKRFIKKIAPTHLIIAENDLWLNLLKCEAKIHLVNGKISEKSYLRYRKFPFYAKKIFSNIDTFSLQDEIYQKRFLSLGVPKEKMVISGNLKYDYALEAPCEKENAVIFASTHEGEETLAIEVMKEIWKEYPNLKAYIAPRHPERFETVSKMIHDKRIILINQMGVLPTYFQKAPLAIMGGSFVSHIGGHDIIEPIRFGACPLFGPHMHNQQHLAKITTDYSSGLQTPKETLSKHIINLLKNPSLLTEMQKRGREMLEQFRGAAARSWKQIKSCE